MGYLKKMKTVSRFIDNNFNINFTRLYVDTNSEDQTEFSILRVL